MTQSTMGHAARATRMVETSETLRSHSSAAKRVCVSCEASIEGHGVLYSAKA